MEITLVCKSCKKAFRKDLTDFDETDSFCPYCDNEYVFPSVSAVDTTSQPVQENSVAAKLAKLDARMIRDGEVTNEDMGLEVDLSTRLG